MMSVSLPRFPAWNTHRRPTLDPREALENFFQTPWLFYFERELNELAAILEANGMVEWSRVPKLYFILRGLGSQHLISVFVVNGVSDKSIPLEGPLLLAKPIGITEEFASEFERFQARVVPQPQSIYEKHLQGYLDSNRDLDKDPLDDVDFQQIGRLLEFCGKPEGASAPKLYYVLHSIRQLDALPTFLSRNYNDMWFPFPGYILRAPLIQSRAAKERFLRIQEDVCSKQWSEDVHLNLLSDDHGFLRTEKSLGSGGTGEVSHVYCRSYRKHYAQKLVLRREGLRYFANEVKTLKSVNHRHCVSLVGSYTDPDYLAILSQPVADMNLGTLLEASTIPLDRKQLLHTFFGCLSTGLAYLHGKGIRHKDIKPQNILIHSNNVLFTDFGLSADASSETTSMVANTPRYNSPEFDDGQSRDKSSDVWSLGCVFFEILAALQGLSISNIKTYFRGKGTRREAFNANPEAVRTWLAEECPEATLAGFSKMPVIAKALTLEMLTTKDSRPDSQTLVQRLGEGVDIGSTMYGSCCKDELKRAAEGRNPGSLDMAPFLASGELLSEEPLDETDPTTRQVSEAQSQDIPEPGDDIVTKTPATPKPSGPTESQLQQDSAISLKTSQEEDGKRPFDVDSAAQQHPAIETESSENFNLFPQDDMEDVVYTQSSAAAGGVLDAAALAAEEIQRRRREKRDRDMSGRILEEIDRLSFVPVPSPDDATSYLIPDDGSPVYVPTKTGQGRDTGNSLLIEYFEDTKAAAKSSSEPSGNVRVKVTPSSTQESVADPRSNIAIPSPHGTDGGKNDTRGPVDSLYSTSSVRSSDGGVRLSDNDIPSSRPWSNARLYTVNGDFPGQDDIGNGNFNPNRHLEVSKGSRVTVLQPSSDFGDKDWPPGEAQSRLCKDSQGHIGWIPLTYLEPSQLDPIVEALKDIKESSSMASDKAALNSHNSVSETSNSPGNGGPTFAARQASIPTMRTPRDIMLARRKREAERAKVLEQATTKEAPLNPDPLPKLPDNQSISAQVPSHDPHASDTTRSGSDTAKDLSGHEYFASNVSLAASNATPNQGDSTVDKDKNQPEPLLVSTGVQYLSGTDPETPKIPSRESNVTLMLAASQDIGKRRPRHYDLHGLLIKSSVTSTTAMAVYDFSASKDDELTFPARQMITGVVPINEDWSFGFWKGKSGLFPNNHVIIHDRLTPTLRTRWPLQDDNLDDSTESSEVVHRTWRASDSSESDSIEMLLTADGMVSLKMQLKLIEKAALGHKMAVTQILGKASDDVWKASWTKALRHSRSTARAHLDYEQEVPLLFLMTAIGIARFRSDARKTAYMIAKRKNHVGVMEALLQHGGPSIQASEDDPESDTDAETASLDSDPDPTDEADPTEYPPLCVAAANGNLEEIQARHYAGADINGTDAQGRTPLLCAVLSGHYDSMVMLYRKGADIHAGTNIWTPLHAAAWKCDERIASKLLEYGASVLARSADGTTALHEAARRGNLKIARMFVEAGADVNAKTKAGRTVLDLASLHGHSGVVSYLRQNHALLAWSKVHVTGILASPQNGGSRSVKSRSPLSHLEDSASTARQKQGPHAWSTAAAKAAHERKGRFPVIPNTSTSQMTAAKDDFVANPGDKKDRPLDDIYGDVDDRNKDTRLPPSELGGLPRISRWSKTTASPGVYAGSPTVPTRKEQSVKDASAQGSEAHVTQTGSGYEPAGNVADRNDPQSSRRTYVVDKHTATGPGALSPANNQTQYSSHEYASSRGLAAATQALNSTNNPHRWPTFSDDQYLPPKPEKQSRLKKFFTGRG